MARFDEITQSNWLTPREKRIKQSVNFFLVFCLVDFLLLIVKPIRKYHFEDFPNLHMLGIALLFGIVVIRIRQAQFEGRNPYMEASREWRERKDMLGPYDFMGAGPDYSNKKYNLFYFIGMVIAFGLIITEITKNL